MIARLLSTACCLLACVTAPALEWTLAESQIDVVSDPHAWRPIPVTVVLSEPAPEGLTLVSPWGAYAQAYIDRTGVQIAMASPIPGEEPAIFGAIAIPAGALTFSCVLPGVSIGPDASLEPDWSTDLELSVSGQGTRRLAVRVRNAARGPTVAIAPVPPAPYGTNAVLATTIDDPAGAGTTMAWAQVGGPAVDLSGVQGPAPLVALPAVGIYVLRGTATDANGRSASSDITVTRTRPRIVVGGSLPLAAAVVDQFGALIPETAYIWTVSGGGSVVDGIFTPGDQPGLRQISVSAPGVPQADTLAVQVAGIPALAWSTPAPLPVGGTLDAVRLAATSSVPGTFTYTPPAGTVLGSAGTVPLRADFTPADADAWEGGTVTTTLTVQDGQGGGDDPQPGPSVPSVTLSVTAGLTGDPAATIDGQATVFTNNKVISVTVSATSTGTIGSVVLSTSDGRSWPLSNGGVEEIPVATEGRLELSASATAERNGQTATGTAAPLVVVVDHTPPRVSWEIAAAATGGAAEPLPSGLIWLGGGTAEDALKTRTTYGVVCYPKAGFALHGTIEELSGLSGRHDAGHEVAFVSHNGTRTAQVVPATAQQIVVPVPADAVDQATPDPATLLLQIEGDARFEAKLTDRAGNTAAASIATVRIKSKPPLAAVGGLALTPSDGEETVINLDGWTSYTPMQTVVTSCDVIAVEQSGKHAVRLSNGPAMLGHGGHRRIAWLLPQPVGVSIGAETPLSLELTDLAGQSQEWTTAAKLRAHRQMSFPDQSLSFEERAVVAVDYNEVYDVMSILISFGFPERIWERRMSLPPWDIAIITGAGAADFSNSFEIPGKIGHVVRAFQPLDEPPAELPIENSAFMAFLADDDYDCDDQCIAPRAVDPQEWAQTKVGIIQRFWDDTGYRDEVQFLDRVEDLSSPATGRINTKGGAEYIRYLNAPEGVRPILGLRNSRADPATGTILWSERARRETSRILVAPPSWNRSAEGRLENLRLVDAGGLAASGGQAWVMWCGAGATAVPPQVNESRASIEVPVTRTTPPGLAQITWSLNRAPLETRIATQVPNAIRSDVHFTVWEESPTSVVTQARLPLRVQGGHRSANVLRVNNDVLVSGTTSELSIDGAFADTWPAPEAEIRFYDTRDVAFMRSTIGDGSRKTARANLLTWLKEEHERLVDLERDDATLIQAINDDWRWFDVWLAVTYEMRLAELSEVPSPEPQLYRSLVLDPYEDAQRAVDSAKEAVDAEKGDGVKKAQLWRKWKIAELEAEMVLCDGLDAYLAEAERQNPHMDPSRAEEIVWDAWVALINRANANQLEGDGEIRAANGYDPYLGDWEEIDFLESDTYREAIEALEGVPDSNLPLLMHAREVQSAGHSNPTAHEILAVTGAYADRTWSAYLPEEAAAYRIRVGPSKVIGLDHLAPMRQELRVQLDIGSEVVGLLDVDLKCGIVHAYPDELSQQYAGANGAHRMKEALKIFKPDVVPTVPKFAECLRKRSGKADEPVIIMNSGGDKSVSGCSLVGTEEGDKNVWSFTAKYDSPVFTGDPGEYSVEWDLGGGQVTAGGVTQDSVTVKYMAGHYNPTLNVYRTYSPRTGVRATEKIASASIHTICVYSKYVDGTAWTVTPVAEDDRYGSETKLERKTDEGIGINVHVGVDVKAPGRTRARISPDGYPQNEYWVTAGDSGDLPQPYAFKPESTTKGWTQGYGDPSAAIDDLSVRIKASKNYGDDTTDAKFTTLQLEVGLDANRNHQVEFSEVDSTSRVRPYRFWLNDNHDARVRSKFPGQYDYLEEDELNDGVADSSDSKIGCQRDLQDLFRLWVVGSRRSVVGDRIAQTDTRMKMRVKSIAQSPSIRAFLAADPKGGLAHLTDYDGIGRQQSADGEQSRYNTAMTAVVGSDLVSVDIIGSALSSGWLTDANSPDGERKVFPMLLEGVSGGVGEIEVRLTANLDGKEIVLGRGKATLDLRSINKFYEQWTLGDTPPGNTPVQFTYQAPTVNPAHQFQYDDTDKYFDQDRYMLYVHGWNMDAFDKDWFAATAYKRLWWNGYKGRMGMLRWPTACGNDGLWRTLTDPQHYDRSEVIAWQAGERLATWLPQLSARNHGAKVDLLGHSMGNVVVCSALQQTSPSLAGSVGVYIASQAAVPGRLFNPDASLCLTWNPDIPWIPDFGSWNTVDVYQSGLLQNVASRFDVANFHNRNDYALSERVSGVNQKLKPDSGKGYYLNGPLGTEANTVDEFRDRFYRIITRSLSDDVEITHIETYLWSETTTSQEVLSQLAHNDMVQDAVSLPPNASYHIMAYLSESRHHPLGGSPSLVFQPDGDVDLNAGSIWVVPTTKQHPSNEGLDGPYSTHRWHSGQFRMTMPEQKGYWKAVITTCGYGTDGVLP